VRIFKPKRHRSHAERHSKRNRRQAAQPTQEINWSQQIRKAKRQLAEAVRINALPKAQRDSVRIDHPMYYRTDLLPTQKAQVERLKEQRLSVLGNKQASPQSTDDQLRRTEQCADDAKQSTGGYNRSTLEA